MKWKHAFHVVLPGKNLPPVVNHFLKRVAELEWAGRLADDEAVEIELLPALVGMDHRELHLALARVEAARRYFLDLDAFEYARLAAEIYELMDDYLMDRVREDAGPSLEQMTLEELQAEIVTMTEERETYRESGQDPEADVVDRMIRVVQERVEAIHGEGG